MNICVIPSAELSYESGSTLYATQFANVLANIGHNIYMICSKLPRLPNKNIEYVIVDILEHPVIDDYVVSNQRMWDSIDTIVKTVIDIHDNCRLDIVHAHYATINALSALNIYIICGVPYVISSFGRDIFNGSDNDERYRRMVQVTLLHAKYIICSNEIVKSTIEKQIYRSSDNITVLPMPVNTDVFFPLEQNNNETSVFKMLNVVSCFAEEKGIETTIKAVKILKDKKYLVRLYILGRDENPELKNKKYLNKIIQENNLQDEIVFIGQVNNADVAKWLRKIDVLIDSRYVGNYSSVILESLAVSTAIIASSVEGNMEFITDGYNGLLYEVGNELDLANIIANLISNHQIIELLKKNALAWISANNEKYDFKAHVRKIIEIYEKCF